MRWKKEIEQLFKVSLDEEQTASIIDEHKYLQIIAGAGSGKTFTVCCKVYYLVKVKKVPEEDILILSYTNYACEELEQYFKKMNIQIKTQTFHKFSLDLLKVNQIEYQIETDEEKVVNDFVEQLVKANNTLYFKMILPYRVTNPSFIRLIQLTCRISFLRNYFIDEEDYKNRVLSCLKGPKDHPYYEEIQTQFQLYKEKHHILFFNDMIEYANKVLKKSNTILYYSYLFIDEFQDISKERWKLIQTYQRKVNCSLIVVGDDYQSIYQFADSDIKVFLDFMKYYKEGYRIFLNHTYRNSQELLGYAGKSIHYNTNQIDKTLISDKHLENPILVVEYEDSKNTLEQKLSSILNEIFEKNKCTRILLLARYRFEFQIIHTKIVKEIMRKRPKHIQIDMLTIHQAKGLGYDEVILLNLKKGRYGFPSTEMDIDIEEERRLFYVALTRTKNHVYLLVPKKNPSIFYEELFS